MQAILTRLITVYRATLSPLLGPRCRFHPSCGVYAREALLRHGVLYGGWLAVRRLARCHPGSAGGPDPVPAGRPRLGVREAFRRLWKGGAHG